MRASLVAFVTLAAAGAAAPAALALDGPAPNDGECWARFSLVKTVAVNRNVPDLSQIMELRAVSALSSYLKARGGQPDGKPDEKLASYSVTLVNQLQDKTIDGRRVVSDIHACEVKYGLAPTDFSKYRRG